MWKILWILLIPAMLFSQTTDENPAFKRYFSAGFNGLAHYGLWGTTPAHPENDSRPFDYTSYGFGVNMDYQVSKYLSVHFDINQYRRSTPVAKKGGYASGEWIFEMRDYEGWLVGPFEYESELSVKSTGARIGVKIFPFPNLFFDPWLGVYYGYYTWTIGVFSTDNKKTYGNTTGHLTSPTYMNFGADFWDKDKSFGLTIFCELGSPVARNYKIENLINDGWTFMDYGEGFHLFGFYRFGISINFSTLKPAI